MWRNDPHSSSLLSSSFSFSYSSSSASTLSAARLPIDARVCLRVMSTLTLGAEVVISMQSIRSVAALPRGGGEGEGLSLSLAFRAALDVRGVLFLAVAGKAPLRFAMTGLAF